MLLHRRKYLETGIAITVMRRVESCISSSYTRFHKRVFPVFWNAIILIILVQLWVAGQLTPFALAVALLMVLFGIFLIKKTLWDLVDEVRDYGSFLLIRKGDIEEKLMLAHITKISESSLLNPSRITLELARSGAFGKQIAFAPIRPFSWNPLVKSRIGADLAERIEMARQQSRVSSRSMEKEAFNQ